MYEYYYDIIAYILRSKNNYILYGLENSSNNLIFVNKFSFCFRLSVSTHYSTFSRCNYTNSVNQSYANSFWGDVVLDTVINVSRDEDNILVQIYMKQICPNFLLMIFDFHNFIRKCILTLNYHWKPILWALFLQRAIFL